MARRLFTSESVTEGHPDKIADQISDGVLDALIGADPRSRVAVETLITTGQVHVAGEVTTSAYVEIPQLVREGEPVVELGPGLGHLTRFLAATGARVTAVEKDRDMIAVLGKEAIPGVQVVDGNATTVDKAKNGYIYRVATGDAGTTFCAGTAPATVNRSSGEPPRCEGPGCDLR
mgnify:CR=1 FL=1